MPTESWQVRMDDTLHTIDLDEAFLTEEMTVRCDGQVVFNKFDALQLISLTRAGVYRFSIGAHNCVLYKRQIPVGAYDLEVDGVMQEPQLKRGHPPHRS